MKKPRYIQDFEKTCPTLRHLLDEKLDGTMGLWCSIYWEFWETLGKQPRKTKQIIAFSRISIAPKAHRELRMSVECAFGEHLLDRPEAFPLLAKYLTTQDLDSFEKCLIAWNKKPKYTRRRNKLERMIKAEQNKD